MDRNDWEKMAPKLTWPQALLKEKLHLAKATTDSSKQEDVKIAVWDLVWFSSGFLPSVPLFKKLDLKFIDSSQLPSKLAQQPLM